MRRVVVSLVMLVVHRFCCAVRWSDKGERSAAAAEERSEAAVRQRLRTRRRFERFLRSLVGEEEAGIGVIASQHLDIRLRGKRFSWFGACT